jgi:hypothetical protein
MCSGTLDLDLDLGFTFPIQIDTVELFTSPPNLI